MCCGFCGILEREDSVEDVFADLWPVAGPAEQYPHKRGFPSLVTSVKLHAQNQYEPLQRFGAGMFGLGIGEVGAFGGQVFALKYCYEKLFFDSFDADFWRRANSRPKQTQPNLELSQL